MCVTEACSNVRLYLSQYLFILTNLYLFAVSTMLQYIKMLEGQKLNFTKLTK